jgi:hypothetical protein
MKKIILTVQSTGKNKFRLGINLSDSRAYFKTGKTIVILKLSNDLTIESRTACGPPSRQGYDLNHNDLDKWIKDNDFISKVYGKPIKLEFSFEKINDVIVLTFLKKIAQKNLT